VIAGGNQTKNNFYFLDLRNKEMSYRKIDVDGTPYEFTVGKFFIKIRGIGEIRRDLDSPSVKPKDIAELIRTMKQK
jgi:hypothetical protein